MKRSLRFRVLYVALLLAAAGRLAAQTRIGSVNIGATGSGTVNVTLSAKATIGSIQVLTQGAPDLDYTLSSGGTCVVGNSYTAGEGCTVEVGFAPKYPGLRSGAAVLLDSSNNVLATAYFSGIGNGPQTTFNPGSEVALIDHLDVPPYLLTDQNGNVYTSPASTATGGPNITKYTPSGSGYTSSAISLNGRVGGLAIDGAGNFFVASSGQLESFYEETPTSNGYVETVIDTGQSQLHLQDMSVDGDGNVYLSGVSYNSYGLPYLLSVVKETQGPSGYTPSVIYSGDVTCNPGNEGPNSCLPYLAVDAGGNVFVTSYNQVLELSPGSESYAATSIISGLSYAAGIAVDAIGDLFIADGGNNRVVKESLQDGRYIQTVIPTRVFTGPSQVALDPAGDVFIVADLMAPQQLGQVYSGVLKENFPTPSPLTFAKTAPGTPSSDSPRTVMVTNDGTATLNFSGVSYPRDFPEALQVPNACTPVTMLAAGAACGLTISFSPKDLPSNDANPFAISVTVNVVTDTLNVPGTTQEVIVIGQEVRAANSIYIYASPNPSQAGGSITLTAAVEGAASGPVPSGSVIFYYGSTMLGTGTLTNGMTSVATSALPKGADTIHAVYSGDGVYPSTTSNSIMQVVGLSIPSVVVSSPTSSTYMGTPVQFTVTVTGAAGGAVPTGTVTFTSGSAIVGSAPLIAGSATVPVSLTAAGTQTVVASYSGDGNYVSALSLNGVNITATLAQAFGSAAPLTAGSTAPATVTIPSVATLTGISVLTGGVPNLDFTDAGGGTCAIGTTYAQGATCTVNVAFKPTHAGIHLGAVSIMDSTSSAIAISTTYLQGTLDAPQLAFSSNQFSYLFAVPIYPDTPFNVRVPGGVAVDASGNIFVAALGSGVTKWTLSNGSYSQTSLTTTGGPGIAIDGEGNLFVACGVSLCKLTSQSNGSYTQSTVATGFGSLFGVAIDGGGNLFLTDGGASAVYREDLQPDGTYLQSLIGSGWHDPNGLALDASGDIVVANAQYSTSVTEEKLSGGSYSESSVSTDINSPVSATFDPSGTIFAAGNTYYQNLSDGCSSSSLPPAGGQGVWQRRRSRMERGWRT